MNTTQENTIITKIAQSIDIPDSAYENAKQRYQDIGEWFGRKESSFVDNDPHISPHGSFRLGTVTRPLDDMEEYDLDLGCKFQKGISKRNSTQYQLKHGVGNELEKYRSYRGIQEKLEEKHRCWRLNYQDRLKFHMDIVPCIPEDAETRRTIEEAIILRENLDMRLASALSGLTVSITDDRNTRYNAITNDWKISNTEGYARWFETQMKKAHQFLDQKVLVEKAASIDDLPIYKWKTPLQRCVQIFKRHRDVMFQNRKDSKPISIILTTLAARAYSGEADIAEAIKNILHKMGDLVSSTRLRIPNPVNPSEDFADKWATTEGQHLKLEDCFWAWLHQAKADFEIIGSSDQVEFLKEQVKNKFELSFDTTELRKALGVTAPSIITAPKDHTITAPAKPWSQ